LRIAVTSLLSSARWPRLRAPCYAGCALVLVHIAPSLILARGTQLPERFNFCILAKADLQKIMVLTNAARHRTLG
jgi:hypothetical protein